MKALLTVLISVLTVVGCSSPETITQQPSDIVIKSTFNSTTTWNKGQKFLNVIGSTKDPKVDNKSWIALYRDECGIDPGHKSATGAMCPQNALGGHIVKFGQSQHPTKNSLVYIIPICTSENNKPNDEMTVATDNTCVVVLNYWMQ